jgi:asparagine synthase (glutamine-hydrolysing)
MCGICGKLNLIDRGLDYLPLVRTMADVMTHRGPDDAGFYSDDRIALGHRRLSIIDLSTGQQPISNEDGTVWIVFNGEVYNYRELRRDLLVRGHRFTTGTDTEVIVHLYEEHGVACLSQLDGMFAFAIWDTKHRRLFIARDRLGVKPLYYVRTGNTLSFASEMKALLVDPACPRDVNPTAIDRLLTIHYTPGRETPIKGVYKLDPGHYLIAENGAAMTHQYWDLRFPLSPRQIPFEQARDELVDLLDRSVRAHMISDVPVGVLLSGGVDSSGVLSFAAEHSDRPIHTFTIGFEDEQVVDERPYACVAARHFGTRHADITISPNDFLDFLPKYVWHMEELVCEPPAIALYYVAKLAHEHGVKVVLSGEGGDEAFAGYNTYRNMLALETVRQLGAPWPRVAASLASAAARITRNQRFARIAGGLRTPLEQWYSGRTATPDSSFHALTGDLYTPDFRAALHSGSDNGTGTLFHPVERTTPLARMLYADTKTWLPDDLLVKADKMTMANSVELRVPLLDHHVLEFAASLPDHYKIRGSRTKRVLKEALRHRVPAPLLGRKKAGFPVPIIGWLTRDPRLKAFVADVLTDPRTVARGYFQRSAIERLLEANSPSPETGKAVFSLLILELWHRAFVDDFPPAHSTAALAQIRSASNRVSATFLAQNVL